MSDCVSVIIPVYNPGVALERCLQSVVGQTYTDIEIIVVNDGSTDASDAICMNFADSDRRIKYIPQENAGVSAARNKGLELATGKYVCFVDSDDYVEPYYVEAMITTMQGTDADIVIQGLTQIQQSKVKSTDSFEDGQNEVASLSTGQFDRIFYYCGPYCKLFKMEIIKRHNIVFPVDMPYGEDAVFYYAYLEQCHSISTLSATGYNYTVANPNALSTKSLAPDKFWQNQSSRRGAYLKLKQSFGLEPRISKLEMSCRMAGVKGMLKSIFQSKHNDAVAARYIATMLNDPNFDFSLLRPQNLYDKLLLVLVQRHNTLIRKLLKKIYG